LKAHKAKLKVDSCCSTRWLFWWSGHDGVTSKRLWVAKNLWSWRSPTFRGPTKFANIANQVTSQQSGEQWQIRNGS